MTNTPLSRTLAEAANLISNEDYQTRERDRQMANTGKLGSSLDSKEKASKKVYGKDGKVDSKDLKAFLKKANSPKNEDIEEAAKASPQEDEFLTDLTDAQIAAIKPLMKSKNWDKLKAYLMSQKIVDKNFNDITKYKMDRDILSVLQRSFMDYHEQVENVEEGALDEFITESTIEFMLDKKVVLRKRIKDAEVRRARDEWIKFGVLPYESNKEASEKYRKPWKVSTKFVPSGINQGPGYKAGQQRDAVIKESVEHVEEAAGDASSPEAMVRKFNKMTDVNDHTGAAILLATFLKDTKAMKCLKLVKEIHELESSMPHEIFKYRTAWTTYLWKGFSMKYPQVNRNIINNEQVENVEEAAGDASSPEAMVRKFNKMTDVNDHNGATILLATFLKDTKAMKCLKLVKQIHELESSMPHDIWAYRAKWSIQLWKDFSMKYPQVKH